MRFLKRNYWIVITFFCVLLDQISKFLVEWLIPYRDTVFIIPDFFSLHHTRNNGAAFGILAGYRWVFMTVTALIIIFAIYLICSKKIRNFWGVLSLSLVIGGGIGNMIDRIICGEVTDFFAFTFWGYEFAVFNVADIFVCCGTILLAIYILFTHDFDSDKKELKQEDHEET